MAQKTKTLKSLIKLVDENQKPILKKLIDRALHMEKTLLELENKVKEEGAVIETTNGNGFRVLSEHPAQKSYNSMIGRYNALMKTILDSLPKGEEEADELMEFLKKR